MKNGRGIVGQGEGKKCITLLFKFEISISHLTKEAKFSIEYESLAQVRCQGWRTILQINCQEII